METTFDNYELQRFNGVRELSQQDWPIIKFLRLKMLADSPEAYNSTLESTLSLSDEDWIDQAGQHQFFGAFVTGEPVGLCRLEAYPNHLELEVAWLWLAPGQRSTGQAGQLMESAEKAAHLRGETVLAVWVIGENPRAQSFYERLGYRMTGVSEPASHDPSKQSRQYLRHLLPKLLA